MNSLQIPPTDLTPHVLLNANEGKFTFIGKSYPENVNDFYGEIINYITLYAQNPIEKTTLEFNWLYFNTASYKTIVKIISLLKGVQEKGKTLEIRWQCKANDDLMLEKGEELKELLNVNFSIVHV